jgi:hypothetical protein
MEREVGNQKFKIWLLGDSEPKNWQAILNTPFDPRHPIRHNIWTPIIDLIQDELFRNCQKRIDTNEIFIRNAVDDPCKKPNDNLENWDNNDDLKKEITEYKNIVEQNKPIIIFSFGSFSYEFARRCLNELQEKNYKYWNTEKLGEEFRERVSSFDINKTNIIPLLHRSIAGGKFIESHNYFCNENKKDANYFEYTSNEIAKLIEKNICKFSDIFI